MTKETEDRMRLLKRHNDKRTEGKMTKETRDAMAKDWKVREYLISFSLSNSLQRYSRNELFMYLCRRYSMLEWWCNLLMNNHNNTGYPLICRLLSNNYSCVFISFIGIELHLKTKVIMTKKTSPYIWLGLASLWLLICPIFLILVILGFGSSGAINTFYVLTIGVNLFCSYKFGEEKGIAKGILFFIFAISCDIFFCILIFLILYSLSWHN